MRYIDEFRDKAAASRLLEQIAGISLSEPIVLMEVCGSHTMAISRFGIRALLPATVRLVSGPGCPVCVTPISFIDHAVELARLPDVVIATFGDLVRVPGSVSSLEVVRAEGADIRVVYSTLDALGIAQNEPGRKVVFLGVGFETTAPTVAAALLQAHELQLDNFLVLCNHKVMPPPMRALMEAPDVSVRGFICPGHVSTIIGSNAYRFLAEEYGASCVVAGFEPLDILQAVLHLMRQAAEGRAEVENCYGRVVTADGNPAAQAILARAFQPADSVWRGFGVIPGSGLAIRPELASHDAAQVLPVEVPPSRENPACRCPDVLRGVVVPPECPLFGRRCTPATPQGACMVSAEGTCAAYYRYERFTSRQNAATRPADGSEPGSTAGSGKAETPA